MNASIRLRIGLGVLLAISAGATAQSKSDGTSEGAWLDPNGPFDNAGLAKSPYSTPASPPGADELIPVTVSSNLSVQSNAQEGPAHPVEFNPPAVPPFQAFGIVWDNVPEVALAALDARALVLEDEQNPSTCKRMRVSVGREIEVSLSDSAWRDVGIGGVWCMDIVSPGAVAMRLHFTDVELPFGAELWIYAPDHPEGADGPHLGRGPLGDREFWGGTTEGDRVRVELFLPVDAMAGAILWPRIDSLQHGYRSPLADDPEPRGPCHNDVTCSSTWTNVSHGVARISFVENGSGFVCSGGLINPQNGDLTPYFLTSNNCISTNTVAQTTQFFWLYQTTSCNGTPPSLSSVPKSSVATLLVTGTSSDFCLLMEEGSLPCGLFWPGFDMNAISTGLASACIHHPQGGAKRISFGTKATADSSSCSTGSPNFVRINWTDGVTVSGSEGAPVFRNDTQRVYGQLSCGPASCSNMTFDNFGAMSATYSGNATVQLLLAGGSDDALEPNDTCATAITVAEGTFTNRLVKFNHDDWFRISVPAGGQLAATVSFTNANGNIDIDLFSTCGGSAVASSHGTSNVESFVFTNTGSTANFLLHVFLSDCDTRNSYTMVLSASLPNDTCATATVIPGTATSFNPAPYSTTQADASTSEPQESCEVGNVGVSNTVWYSFTPCGSGSVTIDTFGSSYDTVLSMFTGTCTAATQVACSDNAIGNQARLLNVPVVAGTFYMIKVADYNTAVGGGTLDFNFSYSPAPPPNISCATATVIPGNATAFNPTPFCTVGSTVTAGDPAESCGFTTNSNPVWYSFTPCDNGRITVDTNGSNYDTVLSIFRGTCGSAVEVACDDDSGAGLNSQLQNVPVIGGTSYLIKVTDFGNPDGGTLDFNFSYTATTAPVNDNCPSPTIIPKNTLVFSPTPYCTIAANATLSEPQESCEVGGVGVSNTVWYSFTPCTNGNISLDTNGSDYDTVLSVFTGTCSAAVQVACDDDSGTGANSQISNVPVTAGTAYLIKIADYGGPNGGTLVFHFFYSPQAPANDLCSAATLISSSNFNPPLFCTLGATRTPGDPIETCGAPPNDATVWYRFAPAIGGLASMDTFGSNYDTVLSVFSGTCGAATGVACNDDTNGLASSLFNVPLSGGVVYLIEIASYAGTNGGSLSFNFAFRLRGDMDCSGAVTLADVPAFVQALIDPTHFAGCSIDLADMNGDGLRNGRDIKDFIAAILSP